MGYRRMTRISLVRVLFLGSFVTWIAPFEYVCTDQLRNYPDTPLSQQVHCCEFQKKQGIHKIVKPTNRYCSYLPKEIRILDNNTCCYGRTNLVHVWPLMCLSSTNMIRPDPDYQTIHLSRKAYDTPEIRCDGVCGINNAQEMQTAKILSSGTKLRVGAFQEPAYRWVYPLRERTWLRFKDTPVFNYSSESRHIKKLYTECDILPGYLYIRKEQWFRDDYFYRRTFSQCYLKDCLHRLEIPPEANFNSLTTPTKWCYPTIMFDEHVMPLAVHVKNLPKYCNLYVYEKFYSLPYLREDYVYDPDNDEEKGCVLPPICARNGRVDRTYDMVPLYNGKWDATLCEKICVGLEDPNNIRIPPTFYEDMKKIPCRVLPLCDSENKHFNNYAQIPNRFHCIPRCNESFSRLRVRDDDLVLDCIPFLMCKQAGRFANIYKGMPGTIDNPFALDLTCLDEEEICNGEQSAVVHWCVEARIIGTYNRSKVPVLIERTTTMTPRPNILGIAVKDWVIDATQHSVALKGLVFVMMAFNTLISLLIYNGCSRRYWKWIDEIKWMLWLNDRLGIRCKQVFYDVIVDYPYETKNDMVTLARTLRSRQGFERDGMPEWIAQLDSTTREALIDLQFKYYKEIKGLGQADLDEEMDAERDALIDDSMLNGSNKDD